MCDGDHHLTSDDLAFGAAHHAAAEALGVATATLDGRGLVLEATPLFMTWTAAGPGRGFGRAFADCLHADDRSSFATVLAAAARRADAAAATYVWRLAGTPQPRYVRAALRATDDAAPNGPRFALVLAEHAAGRSAVDDITTRTGAGPDDRDASLWEVLEQLPVAVVVGHNADRRWLYVNGLFTRMTGYTLDDVGSTFEWYERAYPNPAYRAEVLAGYEARRSSAMARSDDYASNAAGTHICCKDGTRRFVRTTAFTFQETTIAILVDVTEHKALEISLLAAREAAEQANRAKSRFLASMSHEIRTPMNAVMGFAQLCTMGQDLDGRVREHLGIILKAGDHLLDLIDGILDMARIESGRVTIEPECFDLPAMLEDCCTLLAPRARHKGLRFDLSGTDVLPRGATGDAGRIRQIVINLVGNAIKFTPAGHVRVTAAADPDGDPAADGADRRFLLRVLVEDSGVGVAPEDLDRLFVPFEQVASGRISEQGTGLGLAISREYARLMDGDITVDSRAGVGSRFLFSVPLRAAAAVPVPRPAPPSLPRGLAAGATVPRVLVVDDREANRRLLTRALGTVGFETREARDGHEAVALFSELAPAAVLLDLDLPGLDGIAVIRRIRSARYGADTPVIVVSAVAFDADRRQALDAGADVYLAKPVQLAELFGQLRRLLGVDYV